MHSAWDVSATQTRRIFWKTHGIFWTPHCKKMTTLTPNTSTTSNEPISSHASSRLAILARLKKNFFFRFGKKHEPLQFGKKLNLASTK